MNLIATTLSVAVLALGAPDHTAPTRPGPLEIDVSSGGVVLRWAPSADDRGPVRYEIVESGSLVTTVTTTSHQYSAYPPPPRIFVFAVRAVDAAGNVSASSYRTLGQVWRGDEVPLPPTDLRLERAGRGLVKLSWTAAVVPPGSFVPPVAGYDVLVDGARAGQVGGTSIVLPNPGRGAHTFAVRTRNAVDQLSAPAELRSGSGARTG